MQLNVPEMPPVVLSRETHCCTLFRLFPTCFIFEKSHISESMLEAFILKIKLTLSCKNAPLLKPELYKNTNYIDSSNNNKRRTKLTVLCLHKKNTLLLTCRMEFTVLTSRAQYSYVHTDLQGTVHPSTQQGAASLLTSGIHWLHNLIRLEPHWASPQAWRWRN